MSSLLNNILKIILSDDFHFDGFVNRQNCVWGSEKPRAISEKQMHPQQNVTVWCGFWAGGIIGPYFFENETGQAATVNGARYRDMITQFFLPKLDDIDVANMCFQQTMSHAIQPMKQFNYCMRHFLVVYSLVSVIRIGPLDHVI